MTEGVCHCGHERRRHRVKGCNVLLDGLDDPFVPGARWAECRCRVYDDSILPADGERLEFGKHRQPAPDAETAPMWPPLKGSA